MNVVKNLKKCWNCKFWVPLQSDEENGRCENLNIQSTSEFSCADHRLRDWFKEFSELSEAKKDRFNNWRYFYADRTGQNPSDFQKLKWIDLYGGEE